MPTPSVNMIPVIQKDNIWTAFKGSWAYINYNRRIRLRSIRIRLMRLFKNLTGPIKKAGPL